MITKNLSRCMLYLAQVSNCMLNCVGLSQNVVHNKKMIDI